MTSTGTPRPAAPRKPPAPAPPGPGPARRAYTQARAAGRHAEHGAVRVKRGADVLTHRPPRQYSARGLLTAELLTGVAIVAIRAVADYEPRADGTLKGKIGHPRGQYGPLPVLAGLTISFFLLSFLAARGGTRGRLAVVLGALLIISLGVKSGSQFTAVAGTFSHFGHARLPPGDWQSTGTAAGEPVTTTTTAARRRPARRAPAARHPHPTPAITEIM